MLFPLHTLADTSGEQSAKTISPNNGTEQKQGWIEEKSKRYYYENNVPVKGWVDLNGSKFYLHPETGVMQTGWIKNGSAWYYLANNGVMQTGWVKDGSAWYYLANNGVMQTGWMKDENVWYYLAGSGAMQTGWIKDGSAWYYLTGSGAMQTSWVKDGGVWYYLNANGAWIPNTAADNLSTVWDSDQLILVTTNGYNTVNSNIMTFEKKNGKWNEILNVKGYIGKTGFAVNKREGDLKSPRGKYTIGTAFGRYGNPGTKLPFRDITNKDTIISNSNSSLYNTWQQSGSGGMNIPAFDYGFVINYNTEERIPGKGSGILFHVTDMYTLGCTGTSKEYVILILKWLDPSKKPIIIQTPESELSYY